MTVAELFMENIDEVEMLKEVYKISQCDVDKIQKYYYLFNIMKELSNLFQVRQNIDAYNIKKENVIFIEPLETLYLVGYYDNHGEKDSIQMISYNTLPGFVLEDSLLGTYSIEKLLAIILYDISVDGLLYTMAAHERMALLSYAHENNLSLAELRDVFRKLAIQNRRENKNYENYFDRIENMEIIESVFNDI